MIMKDDRKVIFVGNSHTLKNSELGSVIDEFDQVIRINNAKIVGYEDDVGTKFHSWVVFNPEPNIHDWDRKKWLKFALYFKNYHDKGYSDDDIRDLVSDVNELWYISGLKKDILEKYKKKTLLRRYGLMDTLKRHQSEESFDYIYETVGGHYSTGIGSLMVLLSMYNKVYVTGVDCFNQNDKPVFGHYYDNEVLTGNDAKSTIGPHDFKTEKYLLDAYIKQGRLINLTHDVEIEKSKYIGDEKSHAVCPHCHYGNSFYPWEAHICQHCDRVIN